MTFFPCTFFGWSLLYSPSYVVPPPPPIFPQLTIGRYRSRLAGLYRKCEALRLKKAFYKFLQNSHIFKVLHTGPLQVHECSFIPVQHISGLITCMKQKKSVCLSVSWCHFTSALFTVFLQAEGYFASEKWDKTLMCIESQSHTPALGGELHIYYNINISTYFKQ